MSKRPRLDRVVSVRLAAAEYDAIQEEATRRGMSVSNLIRLGALRESRPAMKLDGRHSMTIASEAARSATIGGPGSTTGSHFVTNSA